MVINYSESFVNQLLDQISFIAQDKPEAAIRFRDDLEKVIGEISLYPLKHRQSIFSDDPDIRDLVFKGYTITFRINVKKDFIEILTLSKYRDR